MAKAKSFEENISRLEQIVLTLEKGEAGLEEALKLFEEGTKLALSCTKQLNTAEQKILRLTKGPDGAPVEQPFDGGAEV